MKNIILSLYILLALLSTAAVFAFADTPTTSTPTTVLPDLNKLIENSHEKIKEVNQKIKEQAILKRIQVLEAQASDYYQKGVELTGEGKLEEARDYFKKAIRITEKPEMVSYIKENELQIKVQAAYQGAIDLYNQKEYQPAKDAFERVNSMAPDYQATRSYLKLIDQDIAAAEAKAAQEQAVQIQKQQQEAQAASDKEKQLELEETKEKDKERQEALDQQARDIAALAEKSAQLYSQIADIADDSLTLQTKKKIQEVNKVLNNIKSDKERQLRQMQEEQFKRQEHEAKVKEDEQRAEAERMYHEGIEFLRSHDYAKAKIEFLGLENLIPDYRSTRRYLSQIDEDIKRGNVEAVTAHEKQEALRLRQLQEKEISEEARHAQEEQEKLYEKKQQEQENLKELAGKASDINDEIIILSHQQDYEAMKVKFKELEDTVTALTSLKYEMAKESDQEGRQKQLTHDEKLRHDETIRIQKQEDRQIHATEAENPPKAIRLILSSQPSDATYFKQREIMQEQNVLFSEAVDRYEHKKYSQARLLFGELADQHDHRAAVWLIKVDRAITRELLKSEEGEARERTEFLEDQVKAQRQLLIIQKRERERQKQLTEELERQRRLYEDDHLLQLRKEEIMKAQERERQRQEEKRLRLEKENEKHQEMFRFHKIKAQINPPAAKPPIVQPHPVEVITPPGAAPAPAIVPPPAMSPRQLRQQEEIAARQKREEERQKEKERRQELKVQREQERQARIKTQAEARQKRQEERQARIKAAAEARQKYIEERQKEKQEERERQLELRAQRAQERQARINEETQVRQKIEEEKQKEKERQQELEAEQEKARAESLSQEEKHREEILQQQTQEREERMKQEEIIHEVDQHRQEMERQERQRQEQLEAQREDVRKQLEDGVEAMYQDALSLYQQGDYAQAEDRFKDVQDIIPGYKLSEHYMDEAHQKSLAVKSQTVNIPASTAATPDAPSPAVSHQDDVSKALDLFDPNAK